MQGQVLGPGGSNYADWNWLEVWAEAEGHMDQGSKEWHEGGVGGLRDRALGKGQVFQEHIQATVFLVEKLLHPPNVVCP